MKAPPNSPSLTSIPSCPVLSSLISAAASGFLKIADPAVDCIQKLVAYGLIRGEADPSGGPDAKLLFRLMESICKCHDLDDDALELMVLRTLLSAVTSTSLRIHGDCLLQIVRTCYDMYLDSKNVVNQTTAKGVADPDTGDRVPADGGRFFFFFF